MSVIDGMQIQGIRNFGPEAGDKQQLNFGTPLTLIVGQNGCGKTTIIECLKYITCGDMPPGCNRGASFVHDPKLALETQILGQVKLKFKSATGQQHFAVRSLEATQKAKKLEVKTIDATITKIGPSRQLESVSGKCIDFQNEMADLLAVSKPIIENVIFCHQEESNWPLDEGKRVKEKFDAIFNATKYIKCLDSMKKLRKSLKDDVKNMEDILKERSLMKNEVHNKRKNLEDKEKTLASLKEKHQDFQEEMVPIAKRLDEIRKIEKDLNEIKVAYESKRSKLEALRTAQDELRLGQNERFDCSDMELRRMIQEFQRDVERKEKELNTVQSGVQKVSRDMKDNQREIKDVTDAKTNLEFSHKNHTMRIKERNQKLQNLASEHGFSEVSGSQEVDDDKAKTILSLLENFIEEEQRKIFAKKKEFENEENKIQSEIDSLRKKEASLEQEIRMKEKQREEAKLKQRNIKMELEKNELEYSAHSLDDVKNELAQVEDGIKQQEKKMNIEEAKEEIERVKRQRTDVEYKLEDKKRIVNKMNRQAQTRSKLDLQVQERESLEQKVNFIKRKRKEEFEHLFTEIPEENVRNKLEALISNLKQRSSELRETKENLDKKKTTLETRIENRRNEIRKKEEDVKNVEEKVLNACKGQQLEVALEKSREQKEHLTKERGNLTSSMTVLSRFIEKLSQDDCCPLCHRDFGTKDEVKNLIQELEDKVKTVPKKLDEAKSKLKKEEKKYEEMVGLKPMKDQANKTQSFIDKIRMDMENDHKEVENVNAQLEENVETLKYVNDDEETATGLSADVVTMDNHMKKIKQLKDQIEELRTSLGSSDGDMTMEEALKQQNDLEKEVKNFRNQESDLQDKLDEHKQELEILKERKLRLSSKELEMKKKLQETETMKEELKNLDRERTTLEEEIEKAKEEVAPFKYQVERIMADKSKKTKEKEKWMDAENAKLQTIRHDQKSAKNLQSSILEYVHSGKEERLKESRQQLIKLEETSNDLESRKKMLEGDQRQLEKELGNQKARKRNLDDEKKIRDKEEEAKALEAEIAKVDLSLQDRDEKSVQDEKNQLNVRYSKMYAESAEIEGRSKEIKGEIRDLKTTLERKEYRDAEMSYNHKFYEKVCTALAIEDLDKYYTALDSAIMRFHVEKMQSINAIIRELWRTTYKGNDIDYVEIQTDEATSVGADKRRVFNYRVVMVKHNIEMDMRGRCSAGQKVLASLIIRLALAETFSLNCGILALDEPTTNLDRENVEALAQALVGIVEKRRHQKNFQLVVITHDFEFLQKLAMRDYIDHYYKVTRNDRGLSIIKKLSTETLG